MRNERKSFYKDYKERVVVFIDILGFKDLIDDTILPDNTTDRENFTKLNKALDLIRESWAPDILKNFKMKATLFSDSAIISFDCNKKESYFNLFYNLLLLEIELIQLGVLCRGGIAIGKCVHTRDKVFGPAVNRAYYLESKIASFPRIVIDKEVFNYVKSLTRDSYFFSDLKGMVKKDSKNKFYIDYFVPALSELDEYDSHYYLADMKSIIEKGFQKAEKCSDPSLKESLYQKYTWLDDQCKEMNLHLPNW
ncbi:MAG: hypothetical protein CVV48_08240 [Spirochaetae bacterium HGW-Spirochaetae-4]|jgi:hypothetical protein|nr:MAG: hypothetical protein CVV48_08240 [Spirochaetae bacterium HGW-Spirochaetae-4]